MKIIILIIAICISSCAKQHYLSKNECLSIHPKTFNEFYDWNNVCGYLSSKSRKGQLRLLINDQTYIIKED